MNIIVDELAKQPEQQTEQIIKHLRGLGETWAIQPMQEAANIFFNEYEASSSISLLTVKQQFTEIAENVHYIYVLISDDPALADYTRCYEKGRRDHVQDLNILIDDKLADNLLTRIKILHQERSTSFEKNIEKNLRLFFNLLSRIIFYPDTQDTDSAFAVFETLNQQRTLRGSKQDMTILADSLRQIGLKIKHARHDIHIF